MKTTIMLMVAFLTYVSSAANFQGFPGFGSVSNAISQYAIPGSTVLSVGVYQNTLTGPKDVSSPTNISLIKVRIHNSDEMNDLMQETAYRITSEALTNDAVDKTLSFHIFAVTSGGTADIGVTYLVCSAEFSLGMSVADNTYYVPSLKGFKMQLPSTMIYPISHLDWARIEVVYNPEKFTNAESAGVIFLRDSRVGPQDWISIDEQYIEVPTAYATAGLDGNTHIKISTLTGTGTNMQFQVSGPLGTRIAETPIITYGMRVLDGKTSFCIDGGDIGRVLSVQTSDSLMGPWTNLDTKLVVDPSPKVFSADSLGNKGFYRIRTLNEVPF